MPEKNESELPSPEELFRPIDAIRKTARPLEPLWGYFLYRKAITSIVGDPGICKTTLGYGLAKSLCLGQPFLDIEAEEPVNSVYADFESADSLVASRANLVIGDEEVPNFFIYNIVDYYLSQIATVLIKFCKENNINLVFIDSQSMAFNTRDENDNAEAIRQMKFLRSIANACNASFILFHHTSKANLIGTRKGTGAFARARLSDVCINLELAEEDKPDIIKLEMVKNRLVDEKVLWFLKKEEGKFRQVEPPLGAIGQATNTKVYKAQKAVLEYMSFGVKYQYAVLVSELGNNGVENSMVQYAVRKLYQQGRLVSPEHGVWVKQQI